MSKIAPCLWFAREAEEAANFYVSLFPDSRIDHVQKNIIDTPAGKPDEVLVVNFTLAGQRFMALNGGSHIEFNHAISLEIDCADQAEVDRLWDGLCNGGAPVECGWVTDRCGVSWQVVPAVLRKYIADPDPAKAARVMQALMRMVKLDIAGLEAAYRG
ncbi:VOC family protein [Rhizobium multihospitium]|uniref:Glyoxalase superfamily enzyme, possibly 3-demethylubiquinone-9 3-methyltransferase n=1 Tax=Rhizobium multihospitium TaxID=410764 RepID=A0A1C3VRF1_9HYPH|nr:VOC family protein [Rhizobium multihospitium]SCB30383.1 Glyoxalase superfamily enzyme, possibly 3-demethylubiquinone-9 3-methyltransferase [Rhizobium multihospitium]